MVRIRRFGIIRTANMVAALYAFIALFFAAFIVLFGALGVAIGPRGTIDSQVGAGIVGVLILALFVVAFYAIVGWVFTAIACAIYNLVAGWVGGVEIQLESTPGGPGGGYAYGYPATAATAAPGAYPVRTPRLRSPRPRAAATFHPRHRSIGGPT